MCGINGFISSQHSQQDRETIVRTMNDRLKHRGPNSDGVYSNNNITLGHRRLSIIDLNESANQPFFSQDKKLVIVFNGEIYNYRELKLELQRAAQGSGYTSYFFQTNSDTEVILAAYLRWGNQCLKYLNGMYAFAIFNTETNTVFAARDRMGVKPFYYHYTENMFVFSSEVRPIINSGIKTFKLNTELISEYIQYQTVLAPNTIVKGIKQLLPGHYLEYANNKATLTEYWKPENYIEQKNEFSYKENCNKVFELLSASIQRRLISDVPFGAFLSGGIDSSIVVALMSKVSSEKINTFNVSFDESEFSESKYAQLIAKKYNTQHHEIKLTPNDFLKELPNALNAMDHPSGDGPNTFIVSKATKNSGITMALSGIGGDELFAGYENFKRLKELQEKWWLKVMPGVALKIGGTIIKNKKRSIGNQKISEILNLNNHELKNIYPLSRSVFTKKELETIVKQNSSAQTISSITSAIKVNDKKILSAISCMEIRTYLQNVLLRDADQMSMAVALEVREPFLDHNLVEFVLGINDDQKYPTSPKKLLVDSLGDLLPSEVVNRPKMGFTLPWQHWLKNELKGFCENNISKLDEKGILKPNAAKNLWDRFLKDDPLVTWSRVWHLVVLNDWIDKNTIDIN
jgi:asparagine synthase (glutamine-hydrolysing)